MARFTAINLPELPQPEAIEQLDFETILAEISGQFNGLQPLLFDGNLQAVIKEAELFTAENEEKYFKIPAADDAGLHYLELESDPIPKLLEISAYREMLMRQRINDGTKATMLAFATGSDLEHEAARFGVVRLLITAGDPNAIPPVEAVYEDDDSLRRRAQLALEGFSTAGPVGAYVFHALSAHGSVKDIDVSAPTFQLESLTAQQQAELPAGAIALTVVNGAGLTDPQPGDVAVTVLSTEGDGTPTQEILDAVEQQLNSEEVRPLTDRLRVRGAEIVNYTVDASLTLYAGPDAAVVLQAAQDALNDYIEDSKRIGLAPTQAGFYRALKQPGVYDVTLNQPAAAITLTDYQSAYCTGTTVVIGGVYG